MNLKLQLGTSALHSDLKMEITSPSAMDAQSSTRSILLRILDCSFLFLAFQAARNLERSS